MQELTVKAFLLAAELHANQTRKASIVPGVPYLSHLMEVAGMVSANGGDDATTAAALLHDVLEDVGNASDEIQLVCGDEVLALVRECTEIGTGAIGGQFKAPWRERKEAYLAHLETVSPGALLISVADKLQSAHELYRQVRVQGDTAYAAFAKREYATVPERKAAVLWFHNRLYRAFLDRVDYMPMDERLRPGIKALVLDFGEVLRDMVA